MHFVPNNWVKNKVLQQLDNFCHGSQKQKVPSVKTRLKEMSNKILQARYLLDRNIYMHENRRRVKKKSGSFWWKSQK